GKVLQWAVLHKGQQIIVPSPASMQIQTDTGSDKIEVLGENVRVSSSNTEEIDTEILPVNYIKRVVPDRYNQLTIHCRGNYGIIFRAYHDAVAYRFFLERKGEVVILNETANFNFPEDHMAFIPYMWDYRDGRIFNCSFESLYDEHRISQFKQDSLAFLPLLVDPGNGKKVVILEADLEDYPGMFLDLNHTGKGFRGVFAPYPLEAERVGRNYIPTQRAGYIARTQGTRLFPWRVIVISEQDRELLDKDIVQQLASPSRIEDPSWIEPGQAAWEWWNDWNISRVDFRAGQNTDTYKYYIDFAADNGLRYMIIDEGWSVRGDLTGTVSHVDLPAIIEYATLRGVGIILWATWLDILQQMDVVFPLYAAMGVKGFKIDFIDRDDQIAVASTYEIAEKAAEHHLLVDFHGVFKPTGLQRTYPNVVGYEGVKGLENVKWAHEDVPRYDVTIPFIRMMAGPMDYTPGAMRNASRHNFRAIHSTPMSQGTRCHQMAMYVIYEVPFQILADNPTNYMKEQECTGFIANIPTTYDETRALDGKVGEYAVTARRKGTDWYVGAMTNWEARELILDFSFLGEGTYEAVVFADGINADREATDYRKEVIRLSAGDRLKIQLSSGGGWAARIYPVDQTSAAK
ncbi:MAG TPA: glycoside hydrolase family 97 protein, partial [Bacteroides sp.]|nr:glycoside hydrolase family 97 protein [Bacteroides sp.]